MSETAPVVSTDLGQISGRMDYVKGAPSSPVYCYLGVPYAEPPVGSRRFLPPTPVQPWSGVRQCTKPGSGCYQDIENTKDGFSPVKIPEEISEDCLYLNVYTPSTSGRRPVMFYIHGGGMNKGMGHIYNGTAHVVHGDVVIVTINYRLGVLGFLTTEDDTCPGNMGLMDQVEALRWVSARISHFGGDPDNITIYGLSAGALSVELLLLLPSTKGLFHKAISQSGSAFIPLSRSTRKLTCQMVKNLGAEAETSEEMLKVLRDTPVDQLIEAERKVLKQLHSFNYRVDGSFLPADPEELYSSGQFHKVPRIVGVCGHEGIYMMQKLCPPKIVHSLTVDSALEVTNAILSSLPLKNVPQRLETIRERYFTRRSDGEQQLTEGDFLRRRLADLFGDVFFHSPGHRSAVYHSTNGGIIYYYVYTHQPSYSQSHHDIPGCSHAEDQAMFWGDPCQADELSMVIKESPYTEDERRLSLQLMQYWANFARSCNPNGSGLCQWPLFDHQTSRYLELDVVSKPGQHWRSSYVSD